MEEIWKDIEGYECLYQASSLGRIKNIKNGVVLKPIILKNGYCNITLHNQKQTVYPYHIIIAKAFPEICGEWFKGCHVHHIDFNPQNNSPQNLVILSKKEHITLHASSEDRKEKHRISRLGRHLSEKTKEKIRISHIGKKCSETTKEKIRKGQNSKAVQQISIDGSLIHIFNSINEAAKQTNIHKGSISDCCNGKRKTAQGFIWRWAV